MQQLLKPGMAKIPFNMNFQTLITLYCNLLFVQSIICSCEPSYPFNNRIKADSSHVTGLLYLTLYGNNGISSLLQSEHVIAAGIKWLIGFAG